MKQIALILLAALSLCAQQEQMVYRTIQLKNVESGEKLDFAMNVLRHTNKNLVLDRRGDTIVLGGNESAVKAAEEFIKTLDVPAKPSRNVELTIYLLSGSTQPGAANAPADLAPVVKQLKGLFNLQSYQVEETAFLRIREGATAKTEGVFQGVDDKSIYRILCQVAGITGEQGSRTIKLTNLNISVERRNRPGTTIAADVDVKENQKIVVGKAGVDLGNSTMFVVVSARVAD